MTPDDLRQLCLSLPQAIETFPFDEEASVFKVSGNGKVFAISRLGTEPLTVSLKCDPEESIALRERYSQITPGYHLNKRHWITVDLSPASAETRATDSMIDEDLIQDLVRDSHDLVRPRSLRA